MEKNRRGLSIRIMDEGIGKKDTIKGTCTPCL